MRHGWRVATLGAALTAAAATAGCGSPDSPAAAAASSSAAALSSAAQAPPGTYGAPVDPSLPNPTDVATDPPVSSAAPVPPAETSAASAAPDSPAGPAAATVVLTYAGWVDSPAGVQVGAYVAGVAESGRTCTLTLTSGSNSATAEVTGEPDVESTSCPNLTVPGSELASGTWTAVVGYSSPSVTGTSSSETVVVP
jgi:hypothetical protein